MTDADNHDQTGISKESKQLQKSKKEKPRRRAKCGGRGDGVGKGSAKAILDLNGGLTAALAGQNRSDNPNYCPLQ